MNCSRLIIGGLAVPLAAAATAQVPQNNQQYNTKSDTAKGVEQIKAQTQEKPYADPVRDKALNDAMKDDGVTPPPATRPKSSGKATPQ